MSKELNEQSSDMDARQASEILVNFYLNCWCYLIMLIVVCIHMTAEKIISLCDRSLKWLENHLEK